MAERENSKKGSSGESKKTAVVIQAKVVAAGTRAIVAALARSGQTGHIINHNRLWN